MLSQESTLTITFNLDLIGGSQQLTKNSVIFSKFAFNFYQIYFNWNFHPQGETFLRKITWEPQVRIYLAFRICFNFYSILKTEAVLQECSRELLGAKFCVFGHFLTGKFFAFFWKTWFSTLICNPSTFYHLGSPWDHWPSYPKPPQLFL